MEDGRQRQKIAEKMLFSELCDVFKKIKNTVKTSKQNVFNEFLRRWRQEAIKQHADGFVEYRVGDISFYPAFRLFLPSKDLRKFHMGETKLNRLVCNHAASIEPLPEPFCRINQDLFVERLVTKAHSCFRISQPKLSIADVNEFLSQMDHEHKIEQQGKAMEKLVRQCTENELRWLFYIILESPERAMGTKSHAMMEWFHRGSNNLWNDGNSLEQICELYAEEEADAVGTPGQAEGNLLCKPFRPMLLKRLNYNKYCLPKIIKSCHRPFYVEVKYDGEHLLVHRFERNNYKYFTRKGIDYTQKMGTTNEMLLSKRIHGHFKPTVVDCVLDCELLIWDKKMQAYVGKSRRASDGNIYDPKHLDDDFFENHTMFERSLAVFDILYLNGECLLKKRLPLEARMKLLNEIFLKQDRSVIFVSTKEMITKATDFFDYYKRAMREEEEGIVVKSLQSLYHTGSRAEKNGWFKIKPDYGMHSTLDLAVVGVRFENAQLEHDKSLLVAARHEGEGTDVIFKVVSSITSRLKRMDHEYLFKALGDKHEWTADRPTWLLGNSEKSHKFDRYVPRENIQVVEVRASGLINGLLQFPSVKTIRNDKLVEEIDSVDDVMQFDQRLRSRPMIDESDMHEATLQMNRRKKNVMQLKPSNQLVKVDATEQNRYSRALNGRKVCVMNANGDVSTQDLQKILISLGATPIANPTSSTAFLVAHNPKTMQCQAWIKKNLFHVVNGDWLVRCKEAQKLLPWQDSDMLHRAPSAPFHLFTLPMEEPITEENGQQGIEEEKDEEDREMDMEEEAGRGNLANGTANGHDIGVAEQSASSEERQAEERGQQALNNMDKLLEESNQIEEKIRQELMENLSDTDCQPVESGNLFADFVFFLHESLHGDRERDQICRKIESQNGQISKELNNRVNHIVVDKMRSGAEKPLFDWNEENGFIADFVSAKWIDECIEEEARKSPVRLHEFIEY